MLFQISLAGKCIRRPCDGQKQLPRRNSRQRSVLYRRRLDAVESVDDGVGGHLNDGQHDLGISVG
jgi:hypothetical protein